MSQNMLPFDKEERNRFGFKMKMKILFIQLFQKYTFKRSQGVVFLTDYAKNTIIEQIGSVKSSVVIPHGIEQQLRNKYSQDTNNFQILYISDFLPYKHQYNVVKSVIDLIKEGFDINLTLIGNTDTYQHNLIKELLEKNKSIATKIKILGQLDFNMVKDYLNNSSLFLFASTCENLPFIVLEAISYGLPVITTDKSPMNQIVAGQNIFFDSLDIKSIKNIIKDNLNEEKLNKISELNYLNSKNYKWKTNVIQTIKYLKSIA
jgi:glycosyltransferase involved in cell wall biosynthesis